MVERKKGVLCGAHNIVNLNSSAVCFLSTVSRTYSFGVTPSLPTKTDDYFENVDFETPSQNRIAP